MSIVRTKSIDEISAVTIDTTFRTTATHKKSQKSFLFLLSLAVLSIVAIRQRPSLYSPGAIQQLNQDLETILNSYDGSRRLQHLHIAFVGDSTSRYIYLHLAFYLHRGRWFADDEIPNLADRRTLPSWNHFHRFANRLLYPSESMDAYFGDGLAHRYENRYYYDPINNNSLTFIAKFGEQASFGHWKPKDVHKTHDIPTSFDPSYAWKYERTTDIIVKHLSRLEPRPQYVVINQGLWENHGLSVEQLPELLEALDYLHIKGIYRTTTASRHNSRNPSTEHEPAYCQALPCWNMSWTHEFTDLMVDDLHYTSKMNNLFVEQLLDFIL